MRPAERSEPRLLARCAVAVACVMAAFGIRLLLAPLLGDELPFMFFIAAVLVSAWYGGAAVGSLALFVGLVLGALFSVPHKTVGWRLEFVETMRAIRFLFTASIGVVLIELLHRGRRRTQAAVEQLEQEVARRKRSEADLTEAKAQLSKYADELEVRVTERTAKLTATVQSLEDLLYHIAHNLRAPLRALEGYSTLLRHGYDDKLDIRGKDFTARISAAARKMDELIQDLLAYGRLGHVEMTLTEIRLEEAVENALFQLSALCAKTGANVKVIGPLPVVRGNLNVVEQALVNVLENAIKFVVPGTTPHIQIWAETRFNAVRLFVQDNGIGVDPKYHERIFRPFERLHSSEVYPGNGIGLAIVKEAMQQIHGAVGVESQLGQGSRFWLEFPQAEGNCALAA